jgi:hypothetical protein
MTMMTMNELDLAPRGGTPWEKLFSFCKPEEEEDDEPKGKCSLLSKFYDTVDTLYLVSSNCNLTFLFAEEKSLLQEHTQSKLNDLDFLDVPDLDDDLSSLEDDSTVQTSLANKPATGRLADLWRKIVFVLLLRWLTELASNSKNKKKPIDDEPMPNL